MNNNWEIQEEIFLRSAEPDIVRNNRVPDNIRIFAFRHDRSLAGMWFGRETVGWADEKPSRIMMVHSGQWSMHFAVRRVFPASYPRRPEVFMLGACAAIDVYPGAGLSLDVLHQKAGYRELVKYKDVYPLLQPEMEEIWQSTAQHFCGGSAWPRSYWLSRMEEILRLIQEPAARLLIKYGLFPVGDIQLNGMSPIAVSRPQYGK